MYFKKEIDLARKNIHVSRAISKLPGRSSEFEETARILANRYTQYDVKETIKNLYKHNKEISDIKKKLITDTIKFFNSRMKKERRLG